MTKSFIKNLFHCLRRSQLRTVDISSDPSSQLTLNTKKRPPKLLFNPHQQPPKVVTTTTTTTTTNFPRPPANGVHMDFQGNTTAGTIRKRAPSLSVTNADLESDIRRPSLQTNEKQRGSEYSRCFSYGVEEKGSQCYTPRIFKPGTLNLRYDRALMKKPASDQPTPMMENGPSLKNIPSEADYIPKITAHTKNWPFFLARNFYRLNTMKLFVTFFINVLLLTFQVNNLCLFIVCVCL